MSYINIEGLKKTYKVGSIDTNALSGITTEIKRGSFVVIVGASGAGKTTLLNIIGGMENASSGTLKIDNKDITNYSKKQLNNYRRNDVGFVFQFYNLIPNITALENIEMACEISNDSFNAKSILNDVGLSSHYNKFPAQLSGGQQQRVSIARAISKNPKLLLCDEPTGALDSETGKDILLLLEKMCTDYNMTVVVITHNHQISLIADMVIELKNGLIHKQYYNVNKHKIAEIEW